MNEEINKAVNQAEVEKIEKVKTALNNLQNKKSKFLFCVPESQNPSASVYEIYFHASVVKKMGYEVIVLPEKGDYVAPKWIEKELTDHKHIPLTDPKLTVSPEDILIIPEVYSNVMEQTKNLPCVRIGLLQSVDYMINSLIPGIIVEIISIILKLMILEFLIIFKNQKHHKNQLYQSLAEIQTRFQNLLNCFSVNFLNIVG